jgi:hypothetical protein
MGLIPPVSIGNVYQQFSSVAEGQVQNIIQFSVPFLLQDQEGVTFTVGARSADNPCAQGLLHHGLKHSMMHNSNAS